MRRNLELKLKSILPKPVGRSLRMADNYRLRLRIWLKVARQIEGYSSKDKKIIRRSLSAAPVKSLRNLYDCWQNPELGSDAEVVVKGIGRFSVRAWSDDLYHVLPAREPEVIAALREHLKPGDTFVDAGANIGFFTILASKLVGPGGKVIAVEMMPDTAAILHRHIARNACDNVTVVENALARTSDEELRATVNDGRFGMASIVSGQGARSITVRTRTLDDILSDVGRVALMKMDLEGAELLALQGALSVLPKIDAIVYEQLQGGEAGELLRSQGYTLDHLETQTVLAKRR